MNNYSNTNAVPLSMAVFLASDGYDHDASTISATTLIKPLRQIILGTRVDNSASSVDLVNMVSSRMGSAIHDGIERAWLNNYEAAMLSLNYPKKVIEKIRINPVGEDRMVDGIIPIYLEQRAHKTVGKHIVSGKFDFVGDGRVEDFKSTTTYTAINNTNDEKYILQGSIYRWLNPDIITRDDMAIQFIFTDWSAARARTEPNYPQQRIQQRVLQLMSIPATDHYVKSKLDQIDRYMDMEESSIPHCNDEDLWRSDPVFKYYKNPEKTARSTKNFDTMQEARLRQIEDGGKGIVIERPGQVTACKYCNAFSVCSQKDSLIAAGDLIIN
jgi:hypothetical protein